MQWLHSRNSKAHKTLPLLFWHRIKPSVATEDKCEVVVPVNAMVSVDTFVQLFRLLVFCLIENVQLA